MEDTNIESPEVLNRKLLDAIIAAPDGHLKNASDSSSQMIRRRLRENGFTRLIIPHKPVSDSDLHQLPGTELPVIIEEMEPDSPGAKSISFNDTADTAFYRGDKFGAPLPPGTHSVMQWLLFNLPARPAPADSAPTCPCVRCSVLEQRGGHFAGIRPLYRLSLFANT